MEWMESWSTDFTLSFKLARKKQRIFGTDCAAENNKTYFVVLSWDSPPRASMPPPSQFSSSCWEVGKSKHAKKVEVIKEVSTSSEMADRSSL